MFAEQGYQQTYINPCVQFVALEPLQPVSGDQLPAGMQLSVLEPSEAVVVDSKWSFRCAVCRGLAARPCSFAGGSSTSSPPTVLLRPHLALCAASPQERHIVDHCARYHQQQPHVMLSCGKRRARCVGVGSGTGLCRQEHHHQLPAPLQTLPGRRLAPRTAGCLSGAQIEPQAAPLRQSQRACRSLCVCAAPTPGLLQRRVTQAGPWRRHDACAAPAPP